MQTQAIRETTSTTAENVYSLTPTYMCIQCSTVSSFADKDSHADGKAHIFSIESRSGCLYCARCNDFVFDPIYEDWRTNRDLPANGKKRKRPAGPTEEERYVHENSNALTCLAGEPRGLYNLGQTCYMSVILQAMVHNPVMRNYFLSVDHDLNECEIDDCVICALTGSFIDIVATEKLDGHGPIDMLWKSWKHNNNLAGYHQQDAHEYFQSLLDHLHSNSTGKSEDSRSCRCQFHQTFWGKLRSTVTCLTCKNVTTADDPMNDLSLDLRQQAKKRKLGTKTAGAKAQPDEAPLELIDCLHNYTSPEKLGEDSYTCRSDSCGNTPQRARKHLTIKKLPLTLCIQLKVFQVQDQNNTDANYNQRYEHNNPKNNPSKIDTALRFPLQLDMSPYTSRALRQKKKANGGIDPIDTASLPNYPSWMQPLTPRSPGWYDLYCVVVHLGKIDAGHYICYCKRDGQWFKYDDSKVTVATEKAVLEQEPYLLFYVVRNLGQGANDAGGSADSSNGNDDALGEDE